MTSAEKAAIPPTAVALGIVALCSAALVALGALAGRPRTIIFGYSVVVMTLPQPDKFVPPAMRAEYNNLIRAGWPTFADALVDLDADPALAAMTIGDDVHPNGDGHQRIAVRVAPVVASLFARAGATRGEHAVDGGLAP